MLTAEEKQEFRNHFLNEIARYISGTDVLFPPVAPCLACVYALEMSDNTVKIGVTTNLERRIKEVSGSVYLDVLSVYSTGFAPFGFMRTIESRCHSAFADKRVRGEFFAITFDEACAELDRHAEEIAAVLKASDEKFLDEVEYFEELQRERSGEKYKPHWNPTQQNTKISHKPFTYAIKLMIDYLKKHGNHFDNESAIYGRITNIVQNACGIIKGQRDCASVANLNKCDMCQNMTASLILNIIALGRAKNLEDFEAQIILQLSNLNNLLCGQPVFLLNEAC